LQSARDHHLFSVSVQQAIGRIERQGNVVFERRVANVMRRAVRPD
jgi:hypothetical protein